MRLIRGSLFHTPKNPFTTENAMLSHDDGALVIEKDAIVAVGEFAVLAKRFPEAEYLDHRGDFILPGFVDTHVHYPQVPIIGSMGLRLLDWLETRTLPEEEKLHDPDYARKQARIFLRQLARNGTTTALVFGAHFAVAMDVFFEEAQQSGLRITAGLVLGDRLLTDKLHTDKERAFKESKALIERWHNKGRLRYAVTPRFSLSCSHELLSVCKALMAEAPGLIFTSHINEQEDEIATVLELCDCQDYLASYEAHDLLSPAAVLAHNVHVTDAELGRLAKAKTSIAHCPSSNMFIGSGLFPLKRHLDHKVHVALGSDVGGGTGFSLFKEGLMAYQTQMLRADGYPLRAAHLLYLATLAGAKALNLEDQIGDFSPGKQADFLIVRPPQRSTLKANLKQAPSPEARLAALFTLAREESIVKTYVAGQVV